MEWQADIEGDAIAIYREAGEEPDRPVSIVRIVRKLLHTDVVRATMISTHESDICMMHGEHVIGVRRGIAAPRARWLIAHELGHWWHDRIGYRGEDIEARCDALGAALIAPRPAWQHVRRAVGCGIKDLAGALATTQSLVLLRRGECEGEPVALVQPRRVLVRGADWGWPDPDTMRRVAKVGAPGVRRVRITDEWKRSGLMAA